MKHLIFTGIIALLLVAAGCEKESLRPPFSPVSATALAPATFESNKAGDSFEWNFGDLYDAQSNTATGKKAVHTFHFAGTYTVKLRVFKHSTYAEYTAVVHVND